MKKKLEGVSVAENNYLTCPKCKKKYHVKSGPSCPHCKTDPVKFREKQQKADAAYKKHKEKEEEAKAKAKAKINMTVCHDCKGEISVTAETCPHCGGKVIRKRKSGCLPLIIVSVIFVIGMMIASGNRQGEKETEKYIGIWKDGPTLKISQALAANNIKTCGEYYFKRHRNFHHRCLVKCQINQNSAFYYYVNTSTKHVTGPINYER